MLSRPDLRIWIDRVLAETGWTAQRWAAEAGVAPTTITRFRKHDTAPMFNTTTLEKLVRAVPPGITAQSHDFLTSPGLITVTVLGEIRSFAFSASPDFPPAKRYEIVVPDDPDIAALPRWALEVRDEAMDREYPLGTLLVCISFEHWPHDIAAGDHVIVNNWRGGMVEVLCREVAERDGWLYLVPRSTDPRLTETIRWRQSAKPGEIADAGAAFAGGPGKLSEASAPADGPCVVAIVVGSYRHRSRQS